MNARRYGEMALLERSGRGALGRVVPPSQRLRPSHWPRWMACIFEPAPVRRPVQDPVTHETRWVAVPDSQVKTRCWIFTAGPDTLSAPPAAGRYSVVAIDWFIDESAGLGRRLRASARTVA